MKNNKTRNTETGSVLIIAMIILVVLAFAASTSIMNSVTNIKVGANYASTLGVFNAAELGIERAKLIAMNTSDFDDLLDTSTYPDNVLIPETETEAGSFYVKATNNLIGAYPDSGGAANDTDNIIILTSYATGKKGNHVEIETYVGRPTSTIFPPGTPGVGGGAVGLCGDSPNIKVWGAGIISGYDHDLTGTPVSPSDGTYGLVLQTPAGSRVEKDPGSITGFLGDEYVDSSMPCDEWLNLSNQLATLGEGPNVQIVTDSKASGSVTWGTVASPMITIINTPSNYFKVTGNIDAAGVIVMASETDLQITGSFNFIGTMILMGNDASVKDQGNADITGNIVINNDIPDSDYEIFSQGSSSIKFSTAAMAVAAQAIDGAGGGGGGSGSQLITYSWAEKY